MKQLFTFIIVISLLPAQAQKINKKLQHQLELMTAGFKSLPLNSNR